MLKKATAWAPVNVALVKYWGKRDEKLRLPANSSLSICLQYLGTKTTVEFKPKLQKDSVILDGKVLGKREYSRVVEHLNRVRLLAGSKLKAKVVSENNFSKSVGLSSSASGFAALSLAASEAVGLKLSSKDLSRLARLGSGSACRSIGDGWVEWRAGDSDKNSFGETLFSQSHWDVRVLVVLLSQKEKKVSTTDGHKLAPTSLFYKKRLEFVEKTLISIKGVVGERNFSRFGELVEDEALNMHAIMLTSKPNLIYWLPETVRVMRAVREWRNEGLKSYFTVNTGQNVFVFCMPKDEGEIVEKLKGLEGVIEVRRDQVGRGARLVKKHLF